MGGRSGDDSASRSGGGLVVATRNCCAGAAWKTTARAATKCPSTQAAMWGQSAVQHAGLALPPCSWQGIVDVALSGAAIAKLLDASTPWTSNSSPSTALSSGRSLVMARVYAYWPH